MVRRTRPGISRFPDVQCTSEGHVGACHRAALCADPLAAPRNDNMKRLLFFDGWIIVAVTFATMAIGVNARTAFSLFFPPTIDEFGWERGVTAGGGLLRFFVFFRCTP